MGKEPTDFFKIPQHATHGVYYTSCAGIVDVVKEEVKPLKEYSC